MLLNHSEGWEMYPITTKMQRNAAIVREITSAILNKVVWLMETNSESLTANKYYKENIPSSL